MGGFTLIADGRFSYGDSNHWRRAELDGNGAPGGAARDALREARRARLLIPNSVLVRASIINESRVKSRRIPIDVVVDGATAPAKLAELPSALLSAARRASPHRRRRTSPSHTRRSAMPPTSSTSQGRTACRCSSF